MMGAEARQTEAEARHDGQRLSTTEQRLGDVRCARIGSERAMCGAGASRADGEGGATPRAAVGEL